MSAEAASIAVAPKPPSGVYMVFLMTTVATLCGVLIVFAYTITLDPIRKNQVAIMSQAVYAVLPGAKTQAIFVQQPGGEFVPAESLDGPGLHVFAGYDDAGSLVGVAVEVMGSGYGGPIRALVGYAPGKQQVLGMKILESKETPGLGDKIAVDPQFRANIQGLDVSIDSNSSKPVKPITVVKAGSKSSAWEIDGITGATISSKAVARMINSAAESIFPAIREHAAQFRRTE